MDAKSQPRPRGSDNRGSSSSDVGLSDSREWREGAISVAKLRPTRRRECKLSFGVFLAILIALGTTVGALAIGLLFYGAIVSGNTVVASDIQTVTLTNVNYLLSVLAVLLSDNLTTLTLYAGSLLSNINAINASASTLLRSEEFRQVLFSHSQTLPDGVFLGLTSVRGFTGYVGSVPSLLFTNSTAVNADGSVELQVFNTDPATGVITTPNRTLPSFHYTIFDWFHGVLARPSRKSWDHAFVFYSAPRIIFACNCLGITASRAVFDARNNTVAVAATNVRLETLSNLLNVTKIGVTGEAFIIDRGGQLIAVSNVARMNFSFAHVTLASSVRDPLFQSALSFLLSSGNGTYAGLGTVRPQFVTLNGEVYLIGTFVLDSEANSNLGWVITVVIPRSDYFSPSDKAASQALIVGVVTVLVVIAITFITSLLVLTLPLRRVAQGIDSVAVSLEVPLLQRRSSFIEEVARIEQSYGHLAVGINSFGKYVPRPIVQQLVHNAAGPTVHVTPRECTFFFSDIIGFTAIAESCSPAMLNLLLTEYFDAMEMVLHELNGLTTDFFGDGLFVFWNAPNYQPDHPNLACEAALRQQRILTALRERWASQGLPLIYIRIGINTGPCLVGNFGNNHHLKYTVVGDSVNVASRLEQLNKVYKTSIMIGHSTYLAVCEKFIVRPLDIVLLKGKTETTLVYELLCRRGEETEAMKRIVLNSSLMLTAVRDHEFERAQLFANDVLADLPNDYAAHSVLEKCQRSKGSQAITV